MSKPDPGTRPGPIDRKKLEDLRKLERPGNEGFLARIVGVFLADAEKRMREIGRGMQAADSEAVALAAHTLKGSCSYVGATHLSDLCRALEEAADRGTLDAARAEEVSREFDQVSAALGAEIGG